LLKQCQVHRNQTIQYKPRPLEIFFNHWHQNTVNEDLSTGLEELFDNLTQNIASVYHVDSNESLKKLFGKVKNLKDIQQSSGTGKQRFQFTLYVTISSWAHWGLESSSESYSKCAPILCCCRSQQLLSSVVASIYQTVVCYAHALHRPWRRASSQYRGTPIYCRVELGQIWSLNNASWELERHKEVLLMFLTLLPKNLRKPNGCHCSIYRCHRISHRHSLEFGLNNIGK
jgi:hypothetical protein